jgi:hypothetical protein
VPVEISAPAGRGDRGPDAPDSVAGPSPVSSAGAVPGVADRREPSPRAPVARTAAEPAPTAPGAPSIRQEAPREAIVIAAPMGEPVEAGEVLVADAGSGGLLVRGAASADRSVVGVVAGEPGTIVVMGFAACRVDASYGAIRAGDLLTTSPTPGRAMRTDDAVPGTILGKALEPLASGTGTIRVLVAPR